MVVVLFFGGLGWVMEKLEWPRPPVLLGLVLGPLAENRLFLSTDNYGLSWTMAARRLDYFCHHTFWDILSGLQEQERTVGS